MYPVSRHGGTADSHSHSRSLAGQLYSPGWVSLQVLGSDISTASLGTTPGAPFLLMGALIPLASQDFCLMLQSTWGRRGQGMLADGPGSSLQAPGFILCPLPPGLAELAARKYKQAAKCFLLASFDHCDFPEVRGKRVSGGEPTPALGRQGESPGVSSLGSLLQWGPGHSEQQGAGGVEPALVLGFLGASVSDPRSLTCLPSCPQLLSPSNVAVYGGLCALATFDRQELQRNVISSR